MRIILILASSTNKYAPLVYGSNSDVRFTTANLPVITYGPVLNEAVDGQQITSCLLYFAQVELNSHQTAAYNKLPESKAKIKLNTHTGNLFL